MRRVLLSSMDAGAAHHMVHVARLLADSGDFAVTAYTCHAARGVFQAFGANFVTVGALGLLRIGAEDFRKKVDAALS